MNEAAKSIQNAEAKVGTVMDLMDIKPTGGYEAAALEPKSNSAPG